MADTKNGSLQKVLLLVLTSVTIHSGFGIFPVFFPCDAENNYTFVDCSRRALTQIPKIKSTNVTTLFLSINHISLVAIDSFSDVLSLEVLDISYNCLPNEINYSPQKLCKFVVEPGALLKLKKLTHLSLAGNSLMNIPKLPPAIVQLNVEKNNIISLTYQNFAGLLSLKHLHMDKNCFHLNPCGTTLTIANMTFQDTKLETLSLSFNNLTEVPVSLPRRLKYLDLSENKISHIKATDFIHFGNLKTLILGWNCQRCDHAAQPCFPCPNNASIKLDPLAFRDLHKLTTLNLRGNSLVELSDDLFNHMDNLIYLDLSDNLLNYAIRNASFFAKLTKLETLNLIYNYEPLKTFSNLTLSLSMQKMQSLKNFFIDGYFFETLEETGIAPLFSLPKLELVDFRNNFMKYANLSMFSHLQKVKYIGFSRNWLMFQQNCPKTSEYDLLQSGHYIRSVQSGGNQLQESHAFDVDPRIERWKEYMFQQQISSSNLHTICQKMWDLSYNNVIEIYAADFQGLEKADCLNLSSNYISQALDGFQFVQVPSLKLLDLSYNRIDLYFKTAFQEVPQLEVLYLNNNEYHFSLKGIGHKFDFLSNLPSLHTLSLAYNEIGTMISTKLKSRSLKTLFFAGNRLDIMWRNGDTTYLHFFTYLTNLTYLDISENKLRYISEEIFACLPQSLKYLNISNNQLDYFPWENITYLEHLQSLDLSHNSLKMLPNKAITFSETLFMMNLSSNSIAWLNKEFFSSAPSLQILILSNNHISIINGDSFPNLFLETLKRLDVSGNPFKCACSVLWFLSFINSTKIDLPYLTTRLKCNLPEGVQGANLLSLDIHSCEDVNGEWGFILTFTIGIIFTFVPVLQTLYGWDMWYIFQVCSAFFHGYSASLKKHYEYDAFIAFDTEQTKVSDWVYKELRANMEGSKKRNSHLCLQERDWICGKATIENLYESIWKSRKTVFVLSRKGFASGFLRQAFYITQQRLLEEKMDVVIFVLLDDIIKHSKYLRMRKILCGKSVLSWPHNPHAQPYFWQRLSSVLRADNHHYYSSHIQQTMQ
ncbi:toll-like receptor 7 [Protopterus annectens]|uniref:toll-like receptor 7 n=1 Tax=Protopterus annectens TaxID=7888 RepID=UPI001CFA02D5|nr:toll-like receptor 7 [Protopterus annectens]